MVSDCGSGCGGSVVVSGCAGGGCDGTMSEVIISEEPVHSELVAPESSSDAPAPAPAEEAPPAPAPDAQTDA